MRKIAHSEHSWSHAVTCRLIIHGIISFTDDCFFLLDNGIVRHQIDPIIVLLRNCQAGDWISGYWRSDTVVWVPHGQTTPLRLGNGLLRAGLRMLLLPVHSLLHRRRSPRGQSRSSVYLSATGEFALYAYAGRPMLSYIVAVWTTHAVHFLLYSNCQCCIGVMQTWTQRGAP